MGLIITTPPLGLTARGTIDPLLGRDWGYYRPVAEVGSDFIEAIALSPFLSTVNGAGASNTNVITPSSADHPGIAIQNTGTTTTGRTALITGTASFVFGTLPAAFRAIAQYSILPTVAEDYIHETGFIDNSANISVDGVFFRVTNTLSLVGVCRSNNIETVSSPLLTVGAGSWYDLRVEINAAANSAAFFAAPIVSASPTYVTRVVTSNIPVGVSRNTGAGSLLRKTAGGTARTVYLDSMYAGIYTPIYF
jgi:hypothetical protein